MKSVLITNGGPHSVATWAEATASHIVDVAEHVAGSRREQAVKLQARVIDILEKHHKTVQDGERSALVTVGHDRVLMDLDAGDHVNIPNIVSEICAAAKGTPWEADFAKPEMESSLEVLLKNHFQTSMDIERSWHADRNPAIDQCKQYKQMRHPGE